MELAKKIYNDAVTSAKKVLGKEGDLPKPRVDFPKICDEANKTAAGLNKGRAELEKLLIDVDADLAKIKAAAKQYANMVDGNNFGLDAKDPKNKKIITEATKIMVDAMKEIQDNMDEWTSRMDKLDKVLENLTY